MEVRIENSESFLDSLFSLLPQRPPASSGMTCYWAATFGAYTLAAYVTHADGRVEMLEDISAASDFIYRDWCVRHDKDQVQNYDDWLVKRKALEPLSWNWGWASDFGLGGRELHLFDDVLGESGLPEPAQVDSWLKQRFGTKRIAYPPFE